MTSVPVTAIPSKSSRTSLDGYLHPPSSIRKGPSRRTTTVCSNQSSALPTIRSRQSSILPQQEHYAAEDPVVHPVAAKEQKTKAQTTHVMGRASRFWHVLESKRKHQEDREALAEKLREKKEQKREGRINNGLAYNTCMLSGIRTCVQRCDAEVSRPLIDDDFNARIQFSSYQYGNYFSPLAKYDFKFKDYASEVFRELREKYFWINSADYLASLTGKYKPNELLSPGKSGSFFYYSKDLRFIIKTIHHTEHKFLLSILREYYAHVKENPHTLLSRFCGLHRVKLLHGRKIHFVVMNNIFPADRIYEKFDLKGSEIGRLYPEEKASMKLDPTLKDLNWIRRGRSLQLGPEKGALFEQQLRRDADFLKLVNTMDYSLLIGIYQMKPDGHRARFLDVPKRITVSSRGTSILEDMTDDGPQVDLFHEDEGGLRARDENNRPLDHIYYLGIIDFLTPYNKRKMVEHFWKGLTNDPHKISPVPAVEYGDRFFNFIRRNIRGAEKVEGRTRT